jgi:hypothetical protein
MQPRCVNGGVHRYSMTVFPVTVQRPSSRSPCSGSTRGSGDSFGSGDAVRWPPIPVHRVVFVSFQTVCN